MAFINNHIFYKGLRVVSSAYFATGTQLHRCLGPLSLYSSQTTCSRKNSIAKNKQLETLVHQFRELNGDNAERNICVKSLNAEVFLQTLGRRFDVSSHNHTVYKLPTVQNSTIWQKAILEPSTRQLVELPTHQIPYVEKLTPALREISPIVDPSPLQKIYDQGAPMLEKHAMPWLVRIRRKKMKKQHLKRLRKKMIFVNRKLRSIKMRKREQEMVLLEQKWKTLGAEFNAEQYIGDRIAKAKCGGWGIDVLAERHAKKMAAQDTGMAQKSTME